MGEASPVWCTEQKYVIASMLSHSLRTGERLVIFDTILNSKKPITYNEIQQRVKIPEYHRVGLFCRDLCKLFFVREKRASKNEKAFFVSEPLKEIIKPICDDVNTLINNRPQQYYGKVFYNIPNYNPKN